MTVYEGRNIDANHEHDSGSRWVDDNFPPALWLRLADRGHFPWLHVDVTRGATTQRDMIVTVNAMASIMELAHNKLVTIVATWDLRGTLRLDA